MKRAFLITIIALSMIGLFAANQTLLLAKSPAGVSATAADTMLTANQLYEQGQYVRAVQAYQQLIEQGLLTPSCTLTTLSEEAADRALELLSGLSMTIRKRYL